MTLRIEESKDKGRELSGIFVHASSQNGDWLGVTAEKGKFLATDDPNVIIFRLANGTLDPQPARVQDTARADLQQP